MARHVRGLQIAEMEKEKSVTEPEPLKPWQKAIAARKAKYEARKRLKEEGQDHAEKT